MKYYYFIGLIFFIIPLFTTCEKEKEEELEIEYGTFIDSRDGYEYKTVKIGHQWWMAENLNSTHYVDGTPLVDGAGAVEDYITKYYFYYDDDSATYADTYGALYNWVAAMNGEEGSENNPSGVQGVCPDGWHLPSDAEWKELEMFLGMSQSEADENTALYYNVRGTDEGGKLKETGISHWNSPNTGATNSSGFTALPGGYRYDMGNYRGMGANATFWSSSEDSTDSAWYRFLYFDKSVVSRPYYYKAGGQSVRCVRDNR